MLFAVVMALVTITTNRETIMKNTIAIGITLAIVEYLFHVS